MQCRDCRLTPTGVLGCDVSSTVLLLLCWSCSGDGAGFLQTAADALAVMSRALGEAHEDTQQLKEMIAAVKAALVS